MKKISVYLGSSPYCLEKYNDVAYSIGCEIARHGYTLIYGGAAVGTMGRLADGAQEHGGEVIGVFPKGFCGTREVRESGISVVREGLNQMIEVADFAQRKQVMEDLSDCAIVLPGSFGTMDELFTYACNRAIEKHSKNVYVLNVDGFYDPLKALLENMKQGVFLKQTMIGVISFYDTVEELFQAIESH